VDDLYPYLPPEARERAQAYAKYDQLYWNDQLQYPLRVMAEETPIFVPNPRTLVDTTAHYYLKGLSVTSEKASGSKMGKVLEAFLDREMFYSRFHANKHRGVARGDYAIHMTADPSKPAGKRISLTPLHPAKVILDTDPDDCTRIIRAHLVDLIPHPDELEAAKGVEVVRELMYWYKGDDEAELPDPEAEADEIGRGFDGDQGTRKVWRRECLWSQDQSWWKASERKLVKTTLEAEPLPEPIDTIPVYWFNNLSWDDEPYGFSELRGFEFISKGISQGTTDQSTALSLLGLGLYATDGGRPTDSTGKDIDWEVYPGFVAEVPAGSYFRKVEGITSVTPNLDHTEYLESKIREAGGLSDVALGRVDVQTAQSGIALAIKFMPTLAKLDERDKAGVDRLTQLFFDWKNWWTAYEGETFTEKIEVKIGDKLPTDRTARINELNNMLDRGVISRKYYRAEMQELGYSFPDDIESQIDDENQKEAEQKAAMAPPGLQQNAMDAANGSKAVPPNPNQPGQVTAKKIVVNQSNNRNRPNESSGTEANQSIAKQARGGKPTAVKSTK
jgi:hypothetical protein